MHDNTGYWQHKRTVDGHNEKQQSQQETGNRPILDKTTDIMTMVRFLRSKGPVSDVCWESFNKFKDPLHQIDVLKLY